MSFLDSMEEETCSKLTENGAMSFSSTTDPVLDLFSLGGAYDSRTEEDKLALINRAYARDKKLTLLTMLYIRDCRGGQGRRDFFRLFLKNIDYSTFSVDQIRELCEIVVMVGRYDDVFSILNDTTRDVVREFILNRFIADERLLNSKDYKHISLLAKWLPTSHSKKTSGMTRIIRTLMGMREEEYRKKISALRTALDIVEKKLVAKDYKDIDYEKVPSLANLKYTSAFLRNDNERYSAYLEGVMNGSKKMNAEVLNPFDIVRRMMSAADPSVIDSCEAMWKSLPDFTNGTNSMVVADVSGSMTEPEYRPMAASVSLAIYFAQHNKGVFHNSVITFSEKPSIYRFKEGDSLSSIVYGVSNMDWGSNTDIDKVFRLVLRTAISHGCSQKDIPSTIYIISDMEFDSGTEGETNHEEAKKMFLDHGYTLPNIVYWNVSARNDTLPVTKNEENVTLCSGYSPVVFKFITEGLTPLDAMKSILSSTRYYDRVMKDF